MTKGGERRDVPILESWSLALCLFDGLSGLPSELGLSLFGCFDYSLMVVVANPEVGAVGFSSLGFLRFSALLPLPDFGFCIDHAHERVSDEIIVCGRWMVVAAGE